MFENHGTKILGYLGGFFSTLTLIHQAGQFDGLMSEAGVRWLGIICALATGVSAAGTVVRGHSNTTAERVAATFDKALMTPPPEKP